mmetsp:Transcript_55630/g.132102  ORF Transcript_55630/g.132102 Transcript_55630/m.132102 type:complete len:510 (+) Transcript_55630:37-1566(+)
MEVRAPLMGHGAPGGRTSRGVLLAAAAGLACVACLAVVTRGTSATALYLPDGVYPEKALPFSKALEAHYTNAKRVGDVKARGALEEYFGAENMHEAEEHAANMKRAGKKHGSKLDNYFDSLGKKYHAQYLEEKAMRKASHPGQLKHKESVMAKDEAVIDAKVAEEKADIPVAAIKRKLPPAADSNKFDADESPQFIAEHKAKLAHSKARAEHATHVAARIESKQEDRAERKADRAAFTAAKEAAKKSAVHNTVHKVRHGTDSHPAVVLPEAGPRKVRTGTANTLQAKAATALAPAGGKVQVGFYFESMCPGCKYYTSNVLSSLLQKPEFTSIVDFKMYPYGNGKLSGSTIECQHGEPECRGNTILACMQELYPIKQDSADPNFVKTFVCMEAKDGNPEEHIAECADSNGISHADIMTCADGDLGAKLALEAAQATEALDPPHQYAPWLVMNGEPMMDDAYELQDKACEAFQGEAPSLCAASALKVVDTKMLAEKRAGAFTVCAKTAGVV